MAIRRVIAYTMHEHEQQLAQTVLDQPVATDAYVVGNASETDIDELRRNGLIVNDLGPAAAPDRQRSAFAPRGQPVSVTPGSYVVIELREPLMQPHRRAIEDAGVDLVERLDTAKFLGRVRLSSATGVVASLPFVAGIAPYDAPVKAHPDRAAPPPGAEPRALTRGTRAPAADRKSTYDVVVHDASRLGEVEQYARGKGIPIVGHGARKLRVEVTTDEAEALNQLEAVSVVERYVPPRLYNDRARVLVGLGAQVTSGLTGTGEIVGVADSGIDESHAVLKTRIARTIARGRAGDPSDPHGHGTHVAATIVAASGSQQGIAPAATLVFQSIMDSGGDLGGLPVDLGELFEQAYQEGARVHNNSWAPTSARCTPSARSKSTSSSIAGATCSS
jgi:hypothetical protein